MAADVQGTIQGFQKAVTETVGVHDSTLRVIDGVLGMIEAAKNDPAEIQKICDEVRKTRDHLANAVSATPPGSSRLDGPQAISMEQAAADRDAAAERTGNLHRTTAETTTAQKAADEKTAAERVHDADRSRLGHGSTAADKAAADKAADELKKNPRRG